MASLLPFFFLGTPHSGSFGFILCFMIQSPRCSFDASAKVVASPLSYGRTSNGLPTRSKSGDENPRLRFTPLVNTPLIYCTHCAERTGENPSVFRRTPGYGHAGWTNPVHGQRYA
jgi:hypothetical protein